MWSKASTKARQNGALGRAPEDVKGSELTIFDLQKANAAKAEETEEKQKTQKQKVFASGAVRELLENKGTEPHALGPQRRSFKPS